MIAAEAFDAWRVVPRLILIAYGWMVWMVSSWYMAIPSANEIQCQADVLRTLLENGTAVDQAKQIACSVVETIGGPTSEQTMFVSIVTGLSSVVIGLYLNTGKSAKWQGGVIDTIQPTNTLANGNNRGNNNGWGNNGGDGGWGSNNGGGNGGGGFFSRRRRKNNQSQRQQPVVDGDDSEELPIEGDNTPMQPDPEDQG